MRFTLATAIAALPFLVVASPTSQTLPTKISLNKRSNLRQQDGSVNATSLRAHKAASVAKIQRGFMAFERNTGVTHPLAAMSSSSKRAVGPEPLTDDDGNLWYGSIDVGTPPTTFTVDFDTGSSDLFLPASDCGSTCSGHTSYNPGESSTSKDAEKTFTLKYGDGSTVQGEQYIDTVTISGLTATGQTIGAAKQYSSEFSSSEFPADGLMGMGFESISDYGAKPVFQTLVSAGQTTEPVFAFKLSSSGAELSLGGSNSALYTGKFAYAPVTKEGYWQVALDGVSVDGKQAVSNLDCIVDTGTTVIMGDPSTVAQFYATVPGAKNQTALLGAGYYSVPCDAIPNVSLTFGGQSFAIAPDIFNLGQASAGSSDCVGGIAADASLTFWVIGDVFLQNTYTVFDFGNTRVGFADLA